jgi:hypothetical protein
MFMNSGILIAEIETISSNSNKSCNLQQLRLIFMVFNIHIKMQH